MNISLKPLTKPTPKAIKVEPPKWTRIVLLIVLGYEALGCLAGGTLLAIRPEGSLMDMPVDMMHGTFPDFLIPGIILFGLGILNTIAFRSVILRKQRDWFNTGLALVGLYIWFVVEIIILRDLHWLHAMWGIPVLLGLVAYIPLLASRHGSETMRKPLLVCGIISTLWYLIITVLVPFFDPAYNSITQTISELSAFNAPTRVMWVLLASPYSILYAALGWGIWYSANGSRLLRWAAILVIVYSILNFYWPPMHLREVIAAGGGTLSDTLHIRWAMMTLTFNIAFMVLAYLASGKTFRIITLLTFIGFIVFGILIGIESPGINSGEPTPHLGLWERINILLFMFWSSAFALMLLKKIGPSLKKDTTAKFLFSQS